MFINTTSTILLLFSFGVLWTEGQAAYCQSLSTCKISCTWKQCCGEIECTDENNKCYPFPCSLVTTSVTWWCIGNVTVQGIFSDTSTKLTNITFESSNGCTNSCTNAGLQCGSCVPVGPILPINCSTVFTYSLVIPVVSSVLLMRSNLLLTHTHLTTSTINTVSIITGVPATSSSTTSNVVVPAIIGTTALLCLMVAAVFGSILALVLCKTKRKQLPVTNNSDQMSQQRMDNTYSAVQITDLSSTDGVYRTLDREETTTEIPHNLNTPALPTYSSLADVQLNTSNIEDLPLNYDMVRLENMSVSKTGTIDLYSSLAEDTSNAKELPLNYDINRVENMSETKTGGVISQESAEVARVQPVAVYSTVIRLNGKKMTVKLDTPNILVEEKNAE